MNSIGKVRPNQAQIIQFPTKQSTWRQQAARLHNEGREEFRQVCHVACLSAQMVVVPDDNSFFTLIDNMASLKKSSFWLNHAIGQIEEIYNKAYLVHDQADVIPFPAVQGGV